MQGCQMALPLGKVARYDITIYHTGWRKSQERPAQGQGWKSGERPKPG